MTDATAESLPARTPGPREAWAYLTTALGALGGAAVGAVVGRVAAAAGFTFALKHIRLHGDPDQKGFAGALQAAGLAITTLILGVLLAAALAALCVWLGSVLGCGIALRIGNHGLARRTALVCGALEPVTMLLFAWTFGHSAPVRGTTAYVCYGTAVVVAACMARRLATGAGQPTASRISSETSKLE